MSCDSILREKGFKLTPQRRLILGIIHDARGHLKAEEVLERVLDKVQGVNKSTVYRTLDILEKLGCVVRSELQDRFVYHHADEGHHHHLVCRECGEIVDCDENIYSSIGRELLENYGFRADLRHSTISGTCGSCAVPDGKPSGSEAGRVRPLQSD